MRLPDTFNQYRVVHLPDGTAAIMDVDFGTDRYMEVICSGICGDSGLSLVCAENAYAPAPSSDMGDITLWRLEGDQLKESFFAYLCGWGYQADLFNEGGNTLLAGDVYQVDEYAGDREVRPVTYTWDEAEHRFVAPPKPSPVPPTPAPTSLTVQEPTYPLRIDTCFQMRAAFGQRDFLSALEMLDSAFQQEPQNSSLVPAFHYYRGLTLEALNRPGEALAEYVAIDKAAPDSAWGMLAALHLDPVDNQP